MAEKESLFRKKSLEGVNSPDKLNDYIRVTSPGVWLVLSAVILLLVGVMIWGLFGSVEVTIPVSCEVENKEAVCFITPENAGKVASGMTVYVGNTKGMITQVQQRSVENAGEITVATALVPGVSDGSYDAKIVTETIRPIQFITH